MRVVVITGGIGSGKSEVCRILSEMGFTAQYNADLRVKALYDEHPTLLDDIESELGMELRDADGKFQSRKLAEKIFSDRKALEAVENLVFPTLIDDFRLFADRHSDEKIIIFESATVLEKPQFAGFGDMTVLVDAPYSIRLERACGRDGAKREEVIARMANQKLMNSLSEGHADPRIDAVIMNCSDIDDLKIKVLSLFNEDSFLRKIRASESPFPEERDLGIG